MLTDGQRAYLTLMLRRKTDPCWVYRHGQIGTGGMTESQRAVAQSRARFRIVSGPSRAGKSGHSAWEIAAAARRIHPTRTTSVTGVYVVMAPYREQLGDPWYKKLRKGSELMGKCAEIPFIPEWEVESEGFSYGAGEPTIKHLRLKNGNLLLFVASAGKHVWKTIEGKGLILGILLDEAAGNDKLLEECGSRLLEANSHPQVRADCGGGWLLWSATETKMNSTFRSLKEKCQSGDPQYSQFEYFFLPPGENPAIDMHEREALRSLMSEEAYNIRMLGQGSAGDNMALYPQWNDKFNLVPEGQDHVPSITANWWIGYDPGSHFTGIILCVIEKDRPRLIRVVKVWQHSRTTIEHDVKTVRDYLQGRALEGWVYDQAARKMEKVGSSVIGRLEEVSARRGYDLKLHRGFMMGRSRYEDTVPIVRDYLAPRPDDADYPARFVLNRDPSSGCGLLRWQIQNCAFTEGSYELREDAIQKGNDHCSDSARYLISRMPSWVDRGKNPKLWGEGTAGPDPDEGVEYDPKVSGDVKTPGQEFAKRRIRNRQERMRARQFNAF